FSLCGPLKAREVAQVEVRKPLNCRQARARNASQIHRTLRASKQRLMYSEQNGAESFAMQLSRRQAEFAPSAIAIFHSSSVVSACVYCRCIIGTNLLRARVRPSRSRPISWLFAPIATCFFTLIPRRL